ncbi:transcriptional regulator, ArsR family [Clostridium amylolyticum]|uniref:Transcriptional regulator, ArsR family n=1 Tax=Clostridium amylolyticum TaxID=1121298 RepID=A0A1M6NYQ3_9CLOT|nr:metalloregulator ArsR/SmtB family transcription factor [Clostridium amylolyticum]SHK00855.1 transcriptional regulator, ArsR family [Clostridium amylolyticum]
MNSLTEFFKLLSDETRLRILILLYHKKLCVCELQGIMEESQPKVSKHLAKLRDLGIVQDERQEQFIFYYLNLQENIYRSILKNIVDNIENYEVLKKDVNKLSDAEKFLQLCKK